MASPKEPSSASPAPAPVIGKIGPYTVFRTPPPSSPKPPSPALTTNPPTIPAANNTVLETPKKTAVARPPPFSPVSAPPPVRPPPAQFDKPAAYDRLGFFWDTVSKVQNAHSSVDEYVANWLGLNQSKYQWALDDYYETKGTEKGDDAKTKEMSSKSQCV